MHQVQIVCGLKFQGDIMVSFEKVERNGRKKPFLSPLLFEHLICVVLFAEKRTARENLRSCSKRKI